MCSRYVQPCNVSTAHRFGHEKKQNPCLFL
jgi:hypothetical protein